MVRRSPALLGIDSDFSCGAERPIDTVIVRGLDLGDVSAPRWTIGRRQLFAPANQGPAADQDDLDRNLDAAIEGEWIEIEFDRADATNA